MEELDFSGFVGIDWGEKTHQVCVLDGAGRVRGNRAFSHNGKGLRALVKWLKKLTGVSPASVAVVIERPDGAVVATLLAAASRFMRSTRGSPATCGGFSTMPGTRATGRTPGCWRRRGGCTVMRCAGCSRTRR